MITIWKPSNNKEISSEISEKNILNYKRRSKLVSKTYCHETNKNVMTFKNEIDTLKNCYNFKSKIILLIKSIFFTLIIFSITNPYIFHPLGLEAWIVDFTANMKSNNISHGAGVILGWKEKITVNDIQQVVGIQ